MLYVKNINISISSMLVVVSISTRFHPTNNCQSFNIYHFINVKNPYRNFNLYTHQLNLESFL